MLKLFPRQTPGLRSAEQDFSNLGRDGSRKTVSVAINYYALYAHFLKEEVSSMTRVNPQLSFRRTIVIAAAFLAVTVAAWTPARAQQILGAITGTVRDASGSTVQDVTVTARNTATNLNVTAKSQS